MLKVLGWFHVSTAFWSDTNVNLPLRIFHLPLNLDISPIIIELLTVHCKGQVRRCSLVLLYDESVVYDNRTATRYSQQTILVGDKEFEPSLKSIRKLFLSFLHLLERRSYQAESHANIGRSPASHSLLPPAPTFGQSEGKQQALMQRDGWVAPQRITSHCHIMFPQITRPYRTSLRVEMSKAPFSHEHVAKTARTTFQPQVMHHSCAASHSSLVFGFNTECYISG